MPIEKVDIETFLRLSKKFPVLDVRSPGEFDQAHLPGAFSIPLFTDEQRKIIGTAYKKQSRKIAVEIGINYFSERMKLIQKETAKIITETNHQFPTSKNFVHHDESSMLVHCWRGGMRSETVAWLLGLYGYNIYILKGGYKSFRRWVLKQMEKPHLFHILGGYTGSGKTEVLQEMKQRGKTVIDLEGLANHKGSSFGSLGQAPQPSQEMFENLLALELWEIGEETETLALGNNHKNGAIWLEDESRHIGSVGFPEVFWQQMRSSPLYFMEIPFEERLRFVIDHYGNFDIKSLAACVLNIQKRLGGLETKNALKFLEEGNTKECFEILIKYYDKLYINGLNKRENTTPWLKKIPCSSVDNNNALHLLEME